MDIEYRRDMNHNYMIVKSAGSDIPDDYETRVLITNRIPGLLTCRMQYIDTEIWYSYDVTSLQKLTVFCETRSVGKKEFVAILSEILRILEGLEDYLLDFQHLILQPSCICMDFDTMDIHLMYVPFYCRDIRTSLRELTEYLLGVADHSDQSAIVLGYRFYHEVQENTTQLGDLMGVLYEKNGVSPDMKSEAGPDTFVYMGIAGKEDAQDKGETPGAVPQLSAVEPTDFSDSGNSRKHHRKRDARDVGNRRLRPSRSAVFVVLAGFTCLAVLFAIMHTNLLHYVSIYTLGGILAGICAAILAVSYVKDRRRMEKEQPAERVNEQMEMPESSSTAEVRLPAREEMVSPKKDTDDEPRVTTLLSSYRPAHGPEDRWLIPVSGEYVRWHLTGEDIIIGKQQQYAQMVIDSPTVSRIHARLRFRAGRYFIGDLSSRNGTTVNGESLCGEEERVLSDGDVISFADVSYILSRTEDGARCETSDSVV